MNSTDLNPVLIDGVLTCIVSDATTGHSLSGPRMDCVVAALADVHNSSSPIRAIVIRGEDRTFCNGGDVSAFATASDPGKYVGELAGRFHSFIRTLTDAPIPVIAAAEGWAAGAGMSIICASDVIVGGPSSAFLPAYPGIGLSPDGGMTWTLPRLIGFARARDLLLTNSSIRGSAAHSAGLITRYTEDDQILSTAHELATRIAHQSKSSLAAVKSLLWTAQNNDLSTQLDAEADSISTCAASPDGREGVAAFAEKRRPRFERSTVGA